MPFGFKNMPNKHVMVFQDYFTEWPPVPAQKEITVDWLNCQPKKSFLSLGSRSPSLRLRYELIESLGCLMRVVKLNTTEYNPECYGTVKRFNQNLNTMLSVPSGTFC